jgi:hypothetical protein
MGYRSTGRFAGAYQKTRRGKEVERAEAAGWLGGVAAEIGGRGGVKLL